jgi:hypothetical protein
MVIGGNSGLPYLMSCLHLTASDSLIGSMRIVLGRIVSSPDGEMMRRPGHLPECRRPARQDKRVNVRNRGLMMNEANDGPTNFNSGPSGGNTA